MDAEIKTVDNMLSGGAAALKTAGIENSRREAEMLLGHVLIWPRTSLLAHPEARLTTEQEQGFESLLARRCQREPLPYLLGKAPFLDFEVRVGPGVLIPRPETELLVETAARLLPASSPEKPLRVVDIGTGSGAIALGVARLRPDVEVCATEISPAALAIARDNIRMLDLEDRVQLLEGDLFEPLSRVGSPNPAPTTQEQGRMAFHSHTHTLTDVFTSTHPPIRPSTHPSIHPSIDPTIQPSNHLTMHPSITFGDIAAVLSNPPYIPSDEIPGLQPEVRIYEPKEALDGGPDGLEVIRRLVQGAWEWLAPGGFLAFEIGAGQAGAAMELLHAAGYAGLQALPDLAGIDRVVVGEKP